MLAAAGRAGIVIAGKQPARGFVIEPRPELAEHLFQNQHIFLAMVPDLREGIFVPVCRP